MAVQPEHGNDAALSIPTILAVFHSPLISTLQAVKRALLLSPVTWVMIYNTALHLSNIPPFIYTMADSKIYLNVPFAQKDEAKALGARWDAAQKKWYIPADKDIALFARWQAESGAPESPKPKTSANKTAVTGVKTFATVKDFVAYNGDAPPWD